MQEKHPLSEQLLLAVVVLLGAGIVVVAFVLAIKPAILVRSNTPAPSKVRIEDNSLSNFGGEVLVTPGTHVLPLRVVEPAPITSDKPIQLDIGDWITPDRHGPIEGGKR